MPTNSCEPSALSVGVARIALPMFHVQISAPVAASSAVTSPAPSAANTMAPAAFRTADAARSAPKLKDHSSAPLEAEREYNCEGSGGGNG